MTEHTDNGEMLRLSRNIENWKQKVIYLFYRKALENEENIKLKIENSKVLQEMEDKIRSFEMEKSFLEENLAKFTEEIKILKQTKSALLDGHKDVSTKFNKLVQNQKLCISEVNICFM